MISIPAVVAVVRIGVAIIILVAAVTGTVTRVIAVIIVSVRRVAVAISMAASQGITQDTADQCAGYHGTSVIPVVMSMIGISIIVTVILRICDSRGDQCRNCGTTEN